MIHYSKTPLLLTVVASVLGAQDASRKIGSLDAAAESQQNGAARSTASQLIGCAITNSEKESLGEIQDIVLDSGNNKIAYAVVAFGGFLGMGEKYFAMPWRVIEISQRDAEGKPTAILGLDQETLKAAPGFDKGKWPDMAGASWATQVDTYYAARDSKPRREGATEPEGSAVDGTSGVDRPPTSSTFVHRRLSRLIGMRVVDDSLKTLADVEDLVVDTRAATVDGMLLSFGGVLGMGESLALVPADALTLDTEKRVFVFPCTPTRLAAMALVGGKLPVLNDDGWLIKGRELCAGAGDTQPVSSGDVLPVNASGERSAPFADTYDLTKVEKIKGTVTTIGAVCIGDRNEERVRLRVLVANGREVIVYAAPATFEDQKMLGLRPGTAVEVAGSPARYGSQTVLVAGAITVDGKTARLRDAKGGTTWSKN